MVAIQKKLFYRDILFSDAAICVANKNRQWEVSWRLQTSYFGEVTGIISFGGTEQNL